jgi:tyrosyl-tRNA synthetase
VKKRLEASDGALTFTEFSYQILQGNDFLHLFDAFGCTLEVGGADQWGNITAGTDLVRRMRGKTAYGLTFPLLLDSSGRKFGKSEGNALFMDAELTPVFDWYQYFLRASDQDVIRYLKVFSLRPLEEIDALEAEMRAHPEARAAQKALADELTRLVHGEEALAQAQAATEALYSKKSASDIARSRDVPSAPATLETCAGKPVFAVAAAAGMFKSNGEARRMAAQGGLSLNDAKIDEKRLFSADDVRDGVAVLRSGKKNYFVLRFENP